MARPLSIAQSLAERYPLSIVIPVHNAADRLKLCLEALSRNDVANVEILVIDDASTDDTFGLASAHAALQPDCHVLRLARRGGPAAARNEGLNRAKHPYLFFLDADVVLPERAIYWIRETLDLYAHRPDVAGVLGAYSEKIPWNDFFSNYKNLYTCFLYRATDTQSPYLHTPIFCVKREILQAVGGFDPKLATAEDFRLGVVLGSQGYRFIIDRKIEGTHLKRYTLRSILREDWRRTRDLRQIRFRGPQRRFAYRAHRLNRLLSVALPLPILVLGLLMPIEPRSGIAAALLMVLFYFSNLRFLFYCRRVKGFGFGLKTAGFLFVEMLWVQLCLPAIRYSVRTL